jgi:hypothetical protein
MSDAQWSKFYWADGHVETDLADQTADAVMRPGRDGYMHSFKGTDEVEDGLHVYREDPDA